jgi:hypothetical protein
VKTLKEYIIIKSKESKQLKVFDYLMDNENYKEDLNSFLLDNEMKKDEFMDTAVELMVSFCSYGNWNSKDRPDVDETELTQGFKIETEHTNNPIIAERIALDHLAEFKKYYSYLEVMEKLMGQEYSLDKLQKLVKDVK